MLGINTLAIFKESAVEQWRPPGPLVKVVEADTDSEVFKKTVTEVRSILQRKS